MQNVISLACGGAIPDEPDWQMPMEFFELLREGCAGNLRLLTGENIFSALTRFREHHPVSKSELIKNATALQYAVPAARSIDPQILEEAIKQLPDNQADQIEKVAEKLRNRAEELAELIVRDGWQLVPPKQD